MIDAGAEASAPDSSPDSLTCPVCYGTLRAAVETSCGHAFCRVCLAEWLQQHEGERVCPVCRAEVSSAHPSYTLRAVVRETAVRLGHTIPPSPDAASERQADSALVSSLALPVSPRPHTARGQALGRRRMWLVLLGALLYVLLPVDLFPEALLGPIGFTDDLLLMVAAVLVARDQRARRWCAQQIPRLLS